MSLDLERYMCSRYVNGGREWPNLDCWGMTRLAVKDMHSLDLPMLDGLNADSLIGKTKNYIRLAKIMIECQPMHGAIAAVVNGSVCEHVGLCVDMAGVTYVMETTSETGPRIIPMKAFKEDRGNVLCYAPA